MILRLKQALLLMPMIVASGCASLMPAFQDPQVNLVWFEPAPSDGLLEQRFKVGLRVLNPNGFKLSLRGLSYNVKLNGHKVVSGVTSSNRDIPAYSEVVLSLEAGVNVLSSARFIGDLLNNGGKALDYELEARLDVGLLEPTIVVSEQGQISIGK